MTEIELIEQTALRVGMKSLLNHGAASCVFTEGIEGVSQDHLVAFTREVALHCAVQLADFAPAPAASGAAPADIWIAVAQFEYMVRRNVGGDRSDVAVSKARDRLLAALASREAGKGWNDTEQSALNDWFLSLPEGRRKALLEGDRWMLAGAAFVAGRAALASPQVDPAPDRSMEEVGVMDYDTNTNVRWKDGLTQSTLPAGTRLYRAAAPVQPGAAADDARDAARLHRLQAAIDAMAISTPAAKPAEEQGS